MGKGAEMKNHKTCESCVYFTKTDCTNEKVENLLFAYKEFGCVFWEVNSRQFYGNGIKLRDEGMSVAQADNFLNDNDPAPSPVVKTKARRSAKLKIFRGP